MKPTFTIPEERKTPHPDRVHYTCKVQGPENTQVAAQYWIDEAHRAMLFELCEEINAGQYQVGSNWWRAQVHRRAQEMIDRDDELRPAYKTKIQQAIEAEALYHYAGYASSEEWFASEASLKKGGQKYDYRFWAETLIPWCKAKGVFESPAETDQWFFTPLNADGSSRYGPLRDATPDLRDIIERDVYDLPEEEKVPIVRNILTNTADPTKTRKEKKKDIGQVRQAKMELELRKNGDGQWHLSGDLTDHQKERLEKDLEFSAHIEIIYD